MPKISVIVPVYKAEEYLESCVDSILSQTFSDFEIILVNDGSPDNSGAICDGYAAREERISVIHQENQGQAAARNHALAQAKGPWICFVDSDDLIHPQMLELLYEAVKESGAGISMCPYVEGSQLPEKFLQPYESNFKVLTMDEETLVRLYDADDYPSWVACTKLIRRDLIEKHLFCEGRVFEDNEAVCHWVCEAQTVAQIPYALYFYRKNEDSTTKSSFSLKKLDYLWALEQITRFYGSLGYRQMQRRFAERYNEAVVEACYGVRYMLDRPELVKPIEKSFRAFLREENIRLTKAQFESLLDAAHPKLVKLYWPVEGVVRTLREDGIGGAVRKITEKFQKGGTE